MENLDIVILTSILATLFIIFIGATVKELTSEKPIEGTEDSPRAKMIKNLSKIFDVNDNIK